MLRNHDIELISELVEGNLEDETDARALIRSSAEARAEYEAQKAAYEALKAARPVSMTDHERSALHRDVWTALREDLQPARRMPWYLRLAPVTGALLLIVGLAAVLTQGADDAGVDEPFAEIASDLSAEITQADSGEMGSAGETSEPMGDGDDGGAADLAGEEAAPEAPASEEFFSRVAEMVRSSDLGDATASRSLAALEDPDQAADCLERAGMPDYSVLGEAQSPDTGEEGVSTISYLVVVQSNDEIGPDTQIVFIDTGTCQVAHVES